MALITEIIFYQGPDDGLPTSGLFEGMPMWANDEHILYVATGATTTQEVGANRFLRLDCSNDPLTGDLEIQKAGPVSLTLDDTGSSSGSSITFEDNGISKVNIGYAGSTGIFNIAHGGTGQMNIYHTGSGAAKFGSTSGYAMLYAGSDGVIVNGATGEVGIGPTTMTIDELLHLERTDTGAVYIKAESSNAGDYAAGIILTNTANTTTSWTIENDSSGDLKATANQLGSIGFGPSAMVIDTFVHFESDDFSNTYLKLENSNASDFQVGIQFTNTYSTGKTWQLANNITGDFVLSDVGGFGDTLVVKHGTYANFVYVEAGKFGIGTAGLGIDEVCHIESVYSEDVYLKIESSTATDYAAGIKLANTYDTSTTWTIENNSSGELDIADDGFGSLITLQSDGMIESYGPHYRTHANQDTSYVANDVVQFYHSATSNRYIVFQSELDSATMFRLEFKFYHYNPTETASIIVGGYWNGTTVNNAVINVIGQNGQSSKVKMDNIYFYEKNSNGKLCVVFDSGSSWSYGSMELSKCSLTFNAGGSILPADLAWTVSDVTTMSGYTSVDGAVTKSFVFDSEGNGGFIYGDLTNLRVGIGDLTSSTIDKKLHIQESGTEEVAIKIENSNAGDYNAALYLTNTYNTSTQWIVKNQGSDGTFRIAKTGITDVPLKISNDASVTTLTSNASTGTYIFVENSDTATGYAAGIKMKANGTGAVREWSASVAGATQRFIIKNETSDITPFKIDETAQDNLFRLAHQAADQVSTVGKMLIEGTSSATVMGSTEWLRIRDVSAAATDVVIENANATDSSVRLFFKNTYNTASSADIQLNASGIFYLRQSSSGWGAGPQIYMYPQNSNNGKIGYVSSSGAAGASDEIAHHFLNHDGTTGRGLYKIYTDSHVESGLDASYNCGIYKRYHGSRTTPTDATDPKGYVQIGTVTIGTVCHMRLTLTTGAASFINAMVYEIPLNYNGTSNAWRRVDPTWEAPYSTQDVALEMKINLDSAEFRIIRDSGTNSGTTEWVMELVGSATGTYLTEASGTGTMTQSTTFYTTTNTRSMGTFLAGTSIYYNRTTLAHSDRRLKENFEIIPDAVDKIKAINGYAFDWKEKLDDENENRRQIGLVSQEVEKVLPEAVIMGSKGYQYLNYDGLAGLFVQGFHEQQEIIENQEKRIDALECKIDTLLGKLNTGN